MAKRKKSESESGAAAVAEIPPPAETGVPAAPMTAEEIEQIRQELAAAKKKLRLLERRNKRIIDAEQSVEYWKRYCDDLQAQVNESRKSWKDAVAKLQAEIKRQEGQQELEFRDESPAGQPAASAGATDGPAPVAEPLPEDIAKKTQISSIGLSEAVCEKLATKDVHTVTELEDYIAAGKLVPKVISGLGQTAIDKISDQLTAWRAKNPKPAEIDLRPKRCLKKDCGVEYPGELNACPACQDTLYERVDPTLVPAAELAAKPEAAGTIFDQPAEPAPAEAPAAESTVTDAPVPAEETAA